MARGQSYILPLNSYSVFLLILSRVMGTNSSTVEDNIILVGFSDQPSLEKILFGVVLASYLLTLVGNTIIILIASIDPNLKTPMYFSSPTSP